LLLKNNYGRKKLFDDMAKVHACNTPAFKKKLAGRAAV
jgi:hypothetical protein